MRSDPLHRGHRDRQPVTCPLPTERLPGRVAKTQRGGTPHERETPTIMAADTTITIVGNLVAEPELRFTPSGTAVANFTVASTPRTYDKTTQQWVDGETLFLRCSIWREAAENVAESLERGSRVVVTGRLKARSYEKDGEKRTVHEIDVDEVGPSLRWASAKVVKTQRQQHDGPAGGGWDGPTQQQRRQPSGGGQQWNPDTGTGGWGNTNRDEPPF